MAVEVHQPTCILQGMGRLQGNRTHEGRIRHHDYVPHKAFQSLTFRGKKPQTAPPSPNKKHPGPYKTSGGILRYKSKFNEYYYALVQGSYHKKWSFPKGHINEEEKMFDCTRREIAEETGIDILPIPTTSLQIGFGYYYIFDMDEKYELCPRDKQEIMNTKWVTVEEMKELDTNADVSQFVRMLQE
jgi:ADP-ribose pyrophosphatase YjhB (NUDIX family)